MSKPSSTGKAGLEHPCHADGCKLEIPPRHLMCLKHWRMVPKPLQDEVWKHYRPGQERDKRPTREYLIAMQAAIRAVAAKESPSAVVLERIRPRQRQAEPERPDGSQFFAPIPLPANPDARIFR